MRCGRASGVFTHTDGFNIDTRHIDALFQNLDHDAPGYIRSDDHRTKWTEAFTLDDQFFNTADVAAFAPGDFCRRRHTYQR